MLCECGTGSFKHVDDEDDSPEDVGCTGGSGSPRERRKHGGGGKVNPYAERGLDRFSVVLSDLETRRAKILRRVGSDTGLVLVRFVVQSNGDWTPVVVKIPEPPPPPPPSKNKKAAATKKLTRASSTAAAPLRPPPPASPRSSPPPDATSPREREVVVATSKSIKTTTKVPARKASFSWGTTMRRPSCYWPSVIVLTLVSLAVFGRVFAICLASIWWYVLPTLGRGGGCHDDGAGEGAGARRRNPAGMMMSSMEKKKVRSPQQKRG